MSWLNELVFSGIRLSLPLIFAAYGGMLSERAGVANIALEAYLLASSFAGATVMALTHNFALSIFAALAASVFVASIFSFFTVYARADQIIVGMAVNLLAAGAIPLLCKAIFDVSGQTPSLSSADRISANGVFFAAAIFVVFTVKIYFSRTVLGLRASAAGENPQALRTQGVSVEKTRVISILLGATIAAFGGLYLSMGAGSGYTRNMSAGRGYIALAALIFGRWLPWPTLAGCLLFGLADALQIQLQSMPVLPGGRALPTQFVQALPYLMTLAILAGVAGRTRAPKAINQPEL